MNKIEKFPVILQGAKTGIQICFSSITTGHVVDPGMSKYEVGYFSTTWRPATDDAWKKPSKNAPTVLVHQILEQETAEMVNRVNERLASMGFDDRISRK